MRPYLRSDVRYVKCPEGVYVHGHGGACTVKGAHSYEWLSRLAPHLTGEHTLEELVGPLRAEQRAMVERLVGMLTEQRFVLDAVAEQPHQLDAEEQRVYAAEIAFIGYGLDCAQRRFQRVREARITLLGDGPVLSALLAAGLWSGWREVRVLAPSAQVAALGKAVEPARRDPKQSVRLQPWPERDGPEDQRLRTIAEAADVMLQISAAAGRADLIAFAQACAGVGTAMGQVLVEEDEVWLTPVGAPEVVEAESCWRRLDATRDADASSGGGWLTGPVPGIIAAQLALSCFSHLSGLDTLPPPERAARAPVLTRIELPTLVTRTHRVRPHPLAGPQAPDTEADARTLLDELASGAPVPATDLLERAAEFVDARTGLLGILEEQDLSQIPLSVCRASVSDPYSVLPAWAPAPMVTGWGGDRPTARLRALLAALATYGSLSSGAVPGQRWGLDLATGQPRAVPRTAVYPVLRGTAPMPYQAPVGAAAGRCWSDAIQAGLRAHCEALLVGHREIGGRELPELDAAEALSTVADEQARHLLRLMRAAEQRVRVRDLSAILGLPAFALRTDTDPVVLTCAATATEALRDGLEHTMLLWQARTAGLPSPRAAAALWPVEVQAPRAGEPGDDPRCRVLTDALRRAGHEPVAVPITQDRQARSLLPYVVHVVLCDG